MIVAPLALFKLTVNPASHQDGSAFNYSIPANSSRAVKLVDQVQRDVGTSRLAFGQYFCASTNLRRACAQQPKRSTPRLRAQRAVTGIIIGHHVAAIAIKHTCRHLLSPTGRVVEKDHWFVGSAAGLHPHPGLAAWLPFLLFQHLHAGLIAVDDAAFL